jgi:hypothetical protein
MPEMWPSRVTICIGTGITNAANQFVLTGYAIVAGLNDLECRMSSFIQVRPDDTEIRDQAGTTLISERNCKINGFFPTIVGDQYADVDGVMYKVVGVENDSQKFSTRLHLETIQAAKLPDASNIAGGSGFADWDVVTNVDILANVDTLT